MTRVSEKGGLSRFVDMLTRHTGGCGLALILSKIPSLVPNSDQVESICPSKIIQVSVCDTFLMITGDEGFV